jgi:SAM-dependent methyltransferase
VEPHDPFSRADVVAGYESWYATPFGALADELEQEMLVELLAPLGPGDSLLELGCGTAHFAAALAGRGFRVAGVDPAREMLRVARGRAPVVQADGARLPFADGAFDGVFLVAVLDFVPDPVAVLREARRVARERVVVLALAARSYLALRRRVAARRGNPIFASARFYSRGELLELARAAGAEPEGVRGALYLPPALAGRLAALERRLARARPPGAGVVGFALPGGAR